MKKTSFFSSVIVLLVAISSIQAKIETTYGDIKYSLSGMFRPEMFYGKNISLLNNNNPEDQSFFQRSYLDLTAQAESPCVDVLFQVRNKAIWGNPGSIALTAPARIKVLDDVGGYHTHGFPRNIFWIREVWLAWNISKSIGLNISGEHKLKLGAFSFELGRGIALGDAYAVGPEFLGFFTDNAVDQYAYGALLSGDLIQNYLTYDFYTAILQSKATSLGETAEEIYAQEYGRWQNPQRGFGHINFIVAGRLMCHLFNNDRLGKLLIEPYAMFNHDPEQMVEFAADASSKLGTVGMAAEYVGNRFEGGFDWAVNLGYQKVKGWDRNRVQLEQRNGAIVQVNSNVVDVNNGNKKVPYFGDGSPTQKAIDAAGQSTTPSAQQNGQIIAGDFSGTFAGGIPTNITIGQVSGGGPDVVSNAPQIILQNNETRFRDPYTNKYTGWMFVADAGAWIFKNKLMVAVTAGVASGDTNPNIIMKDGNYSGWTGLQSIYFGKRVRSVFVLGSAGKLRRPLADPTVEQSPNPFAQVVSGFTNIIFWGTGATLSTTICDRKFKMNPNILMYWQQYPTFAYDLKALKISNNRARSYMGLELDLFSEIYPVKDLKIYFVTSVFIPGSHYTDVRGLPLNRRQREALKRVNDTFDQNARVPNLGNDTAYTFNLGMEYRF